MKLRSKALTDTELLCLDRDKFERLVELEPKQRENYVSWPDHAPNMQVELGGASKSTSER